MTQAAWSLVQYMAPGEDAPILGIGDGALVRLAPPELTGLSVLDVLADWSRWEPLLRHLSIEELPVVTGATLLAPLTYPNKVLCAGANFYDHAEEMGTARPDPSAEPFFFLKPPTTTVVGTGAVVPISADPAANIDWEAELAVVIADRCSGLDARNAGDHIAGYMVANDVSARGPFPRPDAVFPAFGWDWLAHKGQDAFCPIGPGLVPAWLVPDPQALTVRLWVNDTLKQDSTTAQMVVGVNELVAAASRLVTLEPGDVVLTGTPAGVGMPRQTFLKPGDLVTVEIEGLGRIENRMVAK